MVKKLPILIFALYLIPTFAFASWWNPFTWFHERSSQSIQSGETATTTPSILVPTIATTTATTTFATPTTDDLNKRIAELEDKLEKAKLGSKKAAATTTLSTHATSTPKAIVSTGALTQKQIVTKAKPAIVLVETAGGFSSGTIIDSKGDVLTDGHAIWIKDSNGAVTGVADKISVTLSDGSKKSARLVGIDEAHDIAVVQISGGDTYPYLKLNYDSGMVKGDSVYIFGYPSGGTGSTGGSSLVVGTVTQKTAATLQAVSDDKPLDTGGAMVNSSGNLIGIPNKSTCKIIEEQTNCLKYTITESSLRSVFPKVIAGMRLYKDKKDETAEEILVRGSLQGMFSNFSSSGILDYAVTIGTGKNSFDYFNSKLGEDQDGKLTKLYLLKLKSIADGIYTAMDLFKSQSYALNVFFINESDNIAKMGDYERATIARVQAENVVKIKEYQTQVDLWSRKKNEYDSYITDPSSTTHDYLSEQGVVEGNAIDYIKAERQKMLDTFSGETVDIF